MRFWSGIRGLVVGLVVLSATPLFGQMTPEQEQQFKYYFYSAREHFINQQYTQALPELLMCETLNPKDGQTKEYIGLIYLISRQGDKATEYLKAAYEADPAKLWQGYFQMLPKENGKERIAVLKKAAEGNPKEEEVWTLYVEELVNNGYLKEGLKAQDKLDQIKGSDIYSVATRHYIYMRQGKFKKALKVVNDYLELEPRDTRVRKLYIQTLIYSHAKWSVLEKAYIEYLQMDPYDMTMLNDYAYTMAINGGDLKKAEAMSAKTIREQPNNATFLDTYAWILHLQGQDNLALFYIRKALDNVGEADRKVIEEHYKTIVK
ncbi:MAG: hypothetical protein J6W92_05280 [Paludibacteraceae bacterium]|nr:hypothetical protein [Paludibacteraceae bacterium]